MNLRKKRLLFLATALAVVLLAGIGYLTSLMLAQTDQEMRKELLEKTHSQIRAIRPEQVQALSGSSNDLQRKEYLLLKSALTDICTTSKQFRFVSLMGKNSDGKVFFYVDSEAPESKNYSPPGQIYTEVSPGIQRVFETGEALVDGPSTDRWGTWVSALFPIFSENVALSSAEGSNQHANTKPIAVLAFDMDAKAWKQESALHIALPLGLILLFLLLLIIGFAITFAHNISKTSHEDTSPPHLLYRFLPPLATMIILMTGGAVTLLWIQHQQSLSKTIAQHVSQMSTLLRTTLTQQTFELDMLSDSIISSYNVKNAIKNRDIAALQAEWMEHFKILQKESGISQLAFYDKNRISLLKLHAPEHPSEENNRFTALEAEQTGKIAAGIETTSLSSISLHLIAPVFIAKEIVGYLELGKEIENLLPHLLSNTDAHIALSIRKKFLNQEAWEHQQRSLGKEPNWNQFTDSVLLYSSLGTLPTVFASLIDLPPPADTYSETANEKKVSFNDKDWLVFETPLQDSTGKTIGQLLVIEDFSSESKAFLQLLTLGGILGAILLSSLLGLMIFFLRRTDADIRRQQEKLRESEIRYRSMFDLSRDAILTLAPPSWHFTSANAAVLTMFGFQDTKHFLEFSPMHVSPPLQPDGRSSQEKALEMINLALKNGSHFFEWTHKRLNNEEFPTTILLSRIDMDGHSFLQAVLRDVSEEKRQQQELLNRREQFELAVHGSNDGIWDWDLRTNSFYLSPKWKAQLGYEPDELEDELPTLLNLMHPDELTALSAPNFLTPYLNGTSEHYSLELRFRHKNETFLWFLVRGAVIRDVDGVPFRIAGSTTDITQRKEKEDLLLQTNRDLEAATALANKMAARAEMASIAKSEFLAVMSHELRTPMNGVVAMASMLVETELNEDQRLCVEIVQSSSDILLRLINEILDFSTIEAGKLALEHLEFNLEDLLDNFAATMAPQAQAKNIELLYDIDSQIPPLLNGDPGRLRQILTNLTGNALKFTSSGEIIIRANLIQLPIENSPLILRFSIRDSGIGIPTDKKDSIFDKFTQVDSSTTRLYGGTGLGLAISKQLVELMGGKISVESEPDQGSEFFFTIALFNQPTPSLAIAQPITAWLNKRILIIDDNASSRDILSMRLTTWGLRPTAVFDTPSALEALTQAYQHNDPFLTILLNMQMPTTTGSAVVIAIRELEATRPSEKNTPIIAMSSQPLRSDFDDCMNAGMCDYISKPISSKNLLKILEKHFGNIDAEPS